MVQTLHVYYQEFEFHGTASCMNSLVLLVTMFGMSLLDTCSSFQCSTELLYNITSSFLQRDIIGKSLSCRRRLGI